MRRLAAAIIAVVLTACACSSVTSGVGTRAAAGSGGSTGSSGSSGAGSATLQTQLLQLSDLPSGWQVDDSASTSDSDAPQCLKQAAARTPALTKTSAGFTAAAGIPALFEALGQFGSAAGADSAFTATAAVVDGCPSFDFSTTDSAHLKATLTRASLATVGDHSTAWRLVIGNDQVSVVGSGTILLARRGTEVLLLLYVNLGNGDVSDILPFARIAVGKMPH